MLLHEIVIFSCRFNNLLIRNIAKILQEWHHVSQAFLAATVIKKRRYKRSFLVQIVDQKEITENG